MSYDLQVADAVRAVREQLRIANKLKVAEHLAGRGEIAASSRIWGEVIKDMGVVVNGDA